MKLPALTAAIVLPLFAACSRQESADISGAKRFEVRGRVCGVEAADSTLLIQHEDIPGFMPSMTMPFTVGAGEGIDGVKTGDAVEFEFVVGDTESWIRDLRKIDASVLDLPEETAAPKTVADTPRLKEGDKLPEIHLTDQDGEEFCNCAFAGKSVLLTFIFTRCPVPDFCPRMSSQFAELEKAIKRDPALAGRVNLLSISFDPDFDTPEVLANYASFHTKDTAFWRFASGSPEEIDRLTHAFSVYRKTEYGTINHGLCTALVGPGGTIQRIWRGNAWKPAEVLEALGTSPAALSVN
ncbi:SCO family protein [Haloferula sargassicola]|uniref:Thioredoxin domain-containing protein n=1 Tax=Haloferula sargassicola TaxID=490096 RepID=A0ABP9ULV2_9BACT